MNKDWIEVELGEICDFKGGGTPSKSNPDYWNGNIPWASIKDIKGDLLTKTQDFISEDGLNNSSANIAEPDEIIIGTRINPGRPIITKIKTAVNQDLKIVKPKINVSTNFLFYSFKNLENAILKVSSGTTVLGINLTNLRQINFPLAPLPEQRAIVAKIEQLFSELDNGIQNLKTAQQKLTLYRQAVLKKAFEGGFTEQWRKERGIEDYENILLSEVCSHITDGDHQAPPKASVGVPFITISNVNKVSLKIDFSDTYYVGEEYYANLKDTRKPFKGDVLYTVTGSFGIPIMVDFDKPFCFQRHIGLLRPLEETNQQYLFYLLQSPQVYLQAKNTSTGTAQKTVSLKSLRNFDIPRFEEAEQHQIVQEIESRLSVCDKVQETITQNLQKAEALRQSILKKAFSGNLLTSNELTACRKEPDYAPASELLKSLSKNNLLKLDL